MAIWNHPPTPELVERLNEKSANTMSHALDIRFSAIGDDWIEATMPVDSRTRQPDGLLHGGASAVLAETLGSVGSVLCVDIAKQTIVGVEINANHLRGVREGRVTGRATPVRLGSRMHVWDIQIRDEAGHLVCVSRLTAMVIERKA